MVSLVINSLSLWQGTNYIVEFGGNLPQGRQDIRPGPTRTSRMQAGPTLKPSEDAPASERSTRRGWPRKDGAGGGPAEEQTCARGRCMRLLKIGESRTRMRGRDDNFRMGPLSGI